MFRKTFVILIVVFANDVRPIVISNLNLIFETFSPMSMVRFFEFNDKGWNITGGCIQDMFLFLDGLHRDVLWSVKLYDATGYYSGGMYDGNIIRTGKTHQCQQLNQEFESFHLNSIGQRHGRGRLLQLNDTIVPFGVHSVNAKYKVNLELAPLNVYGILQTICMPKSCVKKDLQQIMTYTNLPSLRTKDFITDAELVSIRILGGDYRFYDDIGFYFLIGLTALILILMVSSKVFEKFTHFEANVDIKQDQEPMAKAKMNRSIVPRAALSQISNSFSNTERDSLTKFQLSPMTNSLTVNNFSTNKHVNLVQVKKIRTDNMSAIDLDILSGKCENVKSRSIDKKPMSKKISKNILSSFSLEENYKLFLSRKQNSVCDEIPTICGLKVLCILWIHLVNVCKFIQYISESKINHSTASAYILDIIETSGVFGIDTYFFFGGATICHMFYTTTSTMTCELTNSLDQILHLSMLILCKMLRIIFPYIVVLVLLQMSMKHFTDHSTMDIPSLDHLRCPEEMWKNLLYIDTFYPVQQRCMIWSWFMSLETHFFVVACIVLLLARNHQRYAVVICTAFFISSFVTTTILRYNKRSKSSFTYEEHLARFNGMYDQPSARIAPYLLGICLGYILFKSKEKIRLHWMIIICGWIACVLLLTGIIFDQFFLIHANLWFKAAASSITHIIWSMVLFWMILASISQHKGFIGRFLNASAFIPLSKLTNCFLLIHPLIIRLIIMNSDATFHLSIGLIMTLNFGLTMVTFAASFMLYIIYEAPLAALLNTLFYKHNFK